MRRRRGRGTNGVQRRFSSKGYPLNGLRVLVASLDRLHTELVLFTIEIDGRVYQHARIHREGARTPTCAVRCLTATTASGRGVLSAAVCPWSPVSWRYLF